MAKFLKKILLFCLALLLVATIADISLSSYLRKSKIIEFQAWNNIYDHQWNSNLVVLGSSRAFVHFNPHVMDSVLNVNSYNLGFNGSLVNRQVERYYTYCRVLDREPDYIIYSLDYMTLSGFTTNFEREQFYPYFFTDRQLIKQFDKYHHFSIMEKYIPFWRYCSCFFDFHVYDVIKNPEEYEIFYKGFKNERTEYDPSIFNAVESIEYKCDDEALQFFDSFLGDVISKGKKVVFVYTPLYKGLADKITNLERMYDVYGELANKYNILVLDYTGEEMCKDTRFFYNATHLNKVGADIFTLQFSNDLDSLNIIR